VLEDRLNKEREALKTRENIAGEASGALARCEDELNQREATLQERMDRMMNLMRTSLVHHHYLLLLLMMKILLQRSPMRLGLDQLQEHVQSY
jgi:hypothetical protein